MIAYKDNGSHYYIVPVEGEQPIHMSPRIAFKKSLPRKVTPLIEDDAAWVLIGFLEAARRHGGDSLAIHYLQEIHMAKTKGFLCVNLAAEVAVIVHMFAFQAQAHEEVAKAGGPYHGLTIIDDEAQFNALTVEQRCQLARPLLNDKESPATPDGQGFADMAFKVCQRFKNPKPVKGEQKSAEGKPTKEPAAPRAKGVKSLIFEHFTANKDTAHMSVEEIMVTVSGTKASVTTAISDLRSPKYAGKQGTMNLVRLNGKYCLEGSAVASTQAVAQKAADDQAAAAKKAKKALADQEKKDKADAAAKIKQEPAKATA